MATLTFVRGCKNTAIAEKREGTQKSSLITKDKVNKVLQTLLANVRVWQDFSEADQGMPWVKVEKAKSAPPSVALRRERMPAHLSGT